MSENSTSSSSKSIKLETFHKLVEAERGIIKALEQAAPLLRADVNYASRNKPRLATPNDMDTVNEVLALARMLSSRTSAPPSGWDPTMPMVNFSTPNPLPHQLRGGSLAAMQLQGAKLDRTRKNKRRLEEVQQEEERRKADAAAAQVAKDGDLKKTDKNERRLLTEEQRKELDAQRARARVPAKPVDTMNLSDSSSSSSYETDDDDDDGMSE